MQRLIVLVGLVFLPFMENLAQVPTASITSISEFKSAGHIITATYSVELGDGDEEQGSIYQWYRADDAEGTGEDPIMGANAQSYIIKPEDVGKYLAFEVTPVDNNGSTGSAVKQYYATQIANNPPTVTIDEIDGSPYLNNDLTVVVSESDSENDPITLAIQWSRSSDESGPYTDIPEATNNVYRITNDDMDQYLKVTVIPSASSGATPGLNQEMKVQVLNAAPVAIINKIDGDPNIGQTLSVNYSLSDIEEDETIATFQWLSSADFDGSYTNLTDETDPTYVVKSTDKNRFLKIEVTPHAATGTTPGTTVSSRIQVLNNAVPIAQITAVTGTPYIGQQLTIEYTLSDTENDPASATFKWLRSSTSGGVFTEIEGATSQSYTITLDDMGKYLRPSVTPHASSGTTPGIPATQTIQVLNAPPTASNIFISGNARYNSTITANFTYSDADLDAEAVSTYKWFIASAKNGSYSTFTSTTPTTYTIKLDDVGKYVFFEVTPMAVTGTQQGVTARSDTVYIQNQAPVASNVYIEGTLEFGGILRGRYTYSDWENNAQGTSLFKWYRADSEAGIGKTQIPDANLDTYVIRVADFGKYISFEVTPVASVGTAIGISAASGFVGPIMNSAPRATNVQITGTQAVCKELTGQYTYSDSEGEEEGYSTFRWLRASASNGPKAAITGATQISYTLTTEDQGKYIFFEVTPRAAAGEINGTAVVSSPTGAILNLLPRVTFSGGTSVCAGKTAVLSLAFSGTAPFTLNYSNGTQKYSLTTSSNVYNLPVTDGGTYKADSLKDNLGCTVTNLPSQTTVIVNPLPDVQITGLNDAFSVYGPPVPLAGTPSSGTFSGPGVVPASKIFYPNLAGFANSPHAIIYSYTNTSTGCTNTDTVWVKVLDVNAQINGLRTEAKYCTLDKAFIITGFNNKGVNGSFTINGGVGFTDHGNNTATINPSAMAAGQYTISYSYFDNVVLTLTRSITIVQEAKARISTIQDLNYCKNETSVKLTGNYASGIFSGSGISQKQADFYFNPAMAAVGKDKIFYSYTTSYGCKTTDSITFTVFPLPRVQFEVENRCWNSDSTAFINFSAPFDSITSWAWNFGDNTVPETLNKSNKYQPKHLYSSAGQKSVSLIAQNLPGCKDTITKIIRLGDIPKVDFAWDKECFVGSAKVVFTNKTSSVDAIKSYLWTITDGVGAPILLSTKDISLTFPQKKQYSVKLQVGNMNGCKDSTSKLLVLRPIHFIKDSTYSNDFETLKSKWFVAPSIGSDWTWGAPDGRVINKAHSGSNATYTKMGLPRTSRLVEVSSVCFDFTGVQKPFFDMWVNFDSEKGKEGAQLQYIEDNSTTWKTIGALNSGQNWYNDNAIAVFPSTSQYGWSGSSNGWIPVRHNLDELKDLKNVKFRIVYGVNSSSSSKDGFAFDDVQIGQRGKSILFEHFTNRSSTAGNNANIELYEIMNLAGVGAYSIQYHTSFPGLDTLNLRNPQDVASRVLYYGVGAVPVSVLDGGIEPRYVYDFANNTPNINDVNIRALKDPDFDIEITSEYTVPLISGSIEVKALNDIVGRNMSLYIAVVEDVNVQSGTSSLTYYNVLKKFVPSATGTSLKASWTNGETVSVDYSWVSQFIYNSDKVKIVAYIQDEQTHEVYQVKMMKVTPLVSVKPVDTDINGKLVSSLFPNPVSSVATIVFNKALTQAVTARIVDKNGRILNTTVLEKGIGEYIEDFTEYPNGLYFLQIIGQGVKPEVLKVMVLH